MIKRRCRQRHLLRSLAAILFLVPVSWGQCQFNSVSPESEARRTQNTAAEQPVFFDEPKFTVAGVTDASNPVGHGSTAWRTSDTLAKETVSLGMSKASGSGSRSVRSEQSLREAAHDPANFEANRLVGKLLLDDGKPGEAVPYLQKASELKPADYESSYELALAYAESGDYQHSQGVAKRLLAREDTADLHHLLGDDEERLGDPLAAVQDYQRAAELDPDERNLFDWGAELLLHHAPEPASEVFAKGNHQFPSSARMLIGLGVAWYARGSNDRAGACLCQASDLNPDDPNPYRFLGRLQDAEITPSEQILERFKRFVTLQPENAMAHYYYAVALWKRREAGDDANVVGTVQSLLQKAVHLDPKLGAGYLQLGVVYSETNQLGKAISSYQRAVEIDPNLEAAHYRLAQAYRRAGEKEKAENELRTYQQISKQKSEQADRQRSELQQFVYTLRDKQPAAQR